MRRDMPRVLIVGGGIAGASLAYVLARQPGMSVTLVERETQCGAHATGRSAALYMPSYGPPAIRALTLASRSFYSNPPVGFADTPLLTARGALHVAWEQASPLMADAKADDSLEAILSNLKALGAQGESLTAADCLRRCPVLRAEGLIGGVFEHDAMDMDVHAILHGFLRGARQAGCSVVTGAEVQAFDRRRGVWTVHTGAGDFTADLVVNAAGAWADEIGALAGAGSIGLQPKRRSAFTFDPPEGVDCSAWPAVIDAAERFYFKPDAGRLLGSPANANPAPPHDVLPEDLDIAEGIWAIEQSTSLVIGRPKSIWAGLRSFVADGEPVCGHDPDVQGLFWMAGQGGYGIQSAPGLAHAASCLLLDNALPPELLAQGLQAEAMCVQRLRQDRPSGGADSIQSLATASLTSRTNPV